MLEKEFGKSGFKGVIVYISIVNQIIWSKTCTRHPRNRSIRTEPLIQERVELAIIRKQSMFAKHNCFNIDAYFEMFKCLTSMR